MKIFNKNSTLKDKIKKKIQIQLKKFIHISLKKIMNDKIK